MVEPKINPEKFFKFDFSSGRLSYADGRGEAVIVPVDAINEFASASSAGRDDRTFYSFGLCVGRQFGEGMSRIYGGKGMEGDLRPEDFLNNLNSILTLHGFGIISIETWGDVMLLDCEALLEGKSASDFHEGLIAGILRGFSGKEFHAARLEDGPGKKAKFLAGNATTADLARKWAREGAGTGEIVERLKKRKHL